MRCSRFGLSFLLITLFAGPLRSQTNTYITNGSATQNTCNCYTLTKDINTQSGSVWNSTQINLNQPFDFWFNVFLGCKDAEGADGIVFILQTVANSVGGSGGGMGFGGVVPSIGITLDTWQNTEANDPAYDHIGIQANGQVNHGADLAGPVPASATSDNIEDCKWHVLGISWDPVTKYLRSYFDDVLRVEAQVDMVASIFNNNPGVYWGFSAGTGGSNNLQQFCTALNPGYTTDLANNTTCFNGTPVQVSFGNTSVSFAPIASYFWDFGDNTTSTDPNPPPHVYSAPGLYTVQLAITGFDGCKSDTLEKVIAIGDYPVAAFAVFDTCAPFVPRITEQSQVTVGTISQWNWVLDGTPVSTSQHPQLNNLPAIGHTLQLSVTSNYGCTSQPVSQQFIIKRPPAISAAATGACINDPVAFSGQQLDNATFITNWTWNFGDNQSADGQHTIHTYRQPGPYEVRLTATGVNGCKAETPPLSMVMHEAVANAGNDTVIVQHEPFQLHGTGGGTYAWSPVQGLDNPAVADPVVTLQDDITYQLTVTTAEGCTDTDNIFITVFKGSAIYVPTGFTPNNDGINDGLKPLYVGIKSLGYFMIYNRWGQPIFSTQNLGETWNGRFKGAIQPSGVYIWRVRATDYVGKSYEMQGTFTLIR